MTPLVPAVPPPCTTVLDPQCVQQVDKDDSHPWGPPPGELAADVGGGVMNEAAEALQDAITWFVTRTATWWVSTPSPNLEQEQSVQILQRLVQPITISVMVMMLLVVAAKLTLFRRGTPLIDAGGGLAVLAVVTVAGALLPNQLLLIGDAWSSWVLQTAAHGSFESKVTALVLVPNGTPAALTLLLCLIALFVGIIQSALLLLRGGAIILLTALLPLAAAGLMTPATKNWFKKVTGWLLALIFYKPAAAAVYATSFTLIGDGKNLQAVLSGLAMMLLSLVAFPVLLRFFTWTTDSVQSGTGGGVMSSVFSGLTAVGTMRAYGFGAVPGNGGPRPSQAADHADYLNQQLGDQPDPARPQPQPQNHQPQADRPEPTASGSEPVNGLNARDPRQGNRVDAETPRRRASPALP
ncbi:hypothetical protein ACFQU9_03525 [Actinomadura namibiensis]|uniref:hypothetical protein n=1 Tax=Actinomadura kijaniata TaxID=46161 RepID=UPI0036145339